MCGILGLYSQEPRNDLASLAFFGLQSLQHRGQEGSGVAVQDISGKIHVQKQVGMVNQVTDIHIPPNTGHIALGHTRYSTYGDKHSSVNLQPLKVFTSVGPIAIVFNGTLPRADKLRTGFLNKGYGFQSDVETELIAQLLCQNENEKGEKLISWFDKIKYFASISDFAFSCCVMTPTGLFIVRDRYGFRPLIIGKLQSPEMFVVSSESCALKTIGAEIISDVKPGTIVEFSKSGMKTTEFAQPGPKSFCAFETVYFARPDSEFNGKLVHRQRQKIGTQLFHQTSHLFKNTQYVVAGVPDSATPFAMGFIDAALAASDKRFTLTEVFTKNRYIHRTFIEPSQELRKTSVQAKFNPLTQNIKDKRVILIDDSIVRGNTMSYLINLIRQAGAKEVHILVGSPPIKYGCYMGIDMKDATLMVANKYKDEKEIGEALGADSLFYLTIDGLKKVLDESKEYKDTHCFACWTGKYNAALDW